MSCLSRFLEDDSTSIVTATLDGDVVKLNNEYSTNSGKQLSSISFLKSADADLSNLDPADLPQHITAISIPTSSTLSSLHTSIHTLFAPALLSSDEFTHLSESFKETLHSLDKQLQTQQFASSNNAVNSSSNNSDVSDFAVPSERAKQVSCSNTYRPPLGPFEHPAGAIT